MTKHKSSHDVKHSLLWVFCFSVEPEMNIFYNQNVVEVKVSSFFNSRLMDSRWISSFLHMKSALVFISAWMNE